jgi:hypothetical protein
MPPKLILLFLMLGNLNHNTLYNHICSISVICTNFLCYILHHLSDLLFLMLDVISYEGHFCHIVLYKSDFTYIMQISLILSGARQLICMFYFVYSIVPFLTDPFLYSMYYEQLRRYENNFCALRRVHV